MCAKQCSIPWAGSIGRGLSRPTRKTGENSTGLRPLTNFSNLIQKMRAMFAALGADPGPGRRCGISNLVPVDFVCQRNGSHRHKPKLDGQCFHFDRSQSEANRAR